MRFKARYPFPRHTIQVRPRLPPPPPKKKQYGSGGAQPHRMAEVREQLHFSLKLSLRREQAGEISEFDEEHSDSMLGRGAWTERDSEKKMD